MYSNRSFMRVSLLIPALLVLTASLSPAQQKKGEKKKLPPINPAQARLLHTFTGLDGPGLAIAASKDGSLVAAACDRSTIQMWHKDALFGIRAGSGSGNVLKGHQGVVFDLAWNGGPVLASSGQDKKVLLWNVATGKIVNTIETPFLARTLAMSPDGKTLAGAGDDATIQLWDTESGKALRQLKGHKDWVLCLVFSADSKQLISSGYEGLAFLWDVAAAKKIRDLAPPPKPKPAKKGKKAPAKPDPIPVTSAAFSPDGKTALLGRANGTIDWVNTADGKKVRTMTGHTSAVTGLAYHPGNAAIVSCSKDGTLRLWNPANGAQFKELKGHSAWVEGVAFLAQGTRLASVSADRTVRVWALTNP